MVNGATNGPDDGEGLGISSEWILDACVILGSLVQKRNKGVRGSRRLLRKVVSQIPTVVDTEVVEDTNVGMSTSVRNVPGVALESVLDISRFPSLDIKCKQELLLYNLWKNYEMAMTSAALYTSSGRLVRSRLPNGWPPLAPLNPKD
ncbi:hypothetical protein L195_g038613 [Trifolium pratense]|uniref:Uncharacterized protein n=1 Tax=Trifolium pratense TaxID=57577 RepID=A0A2K3LVP0_TRIPR|nr:hypothetical protein L195_g038613 [Trifolium pratense]